MTIINSVVLENSLNKSVLAYWQERAGTSSMPARGDIDPFVDLGSLVQNLILIDVEYEPLRFRFRLVGTEIVNLVGAEMTGMYFDEILELQEQLALIRDDCESIVENHEATSSRARFPAIGSSGFIECECLFMPLSDNGTDVNMILGVSTPIEGKS